MLFVLMRTTAFTYVEDRGAPDCRRNGHYNRGALRNEAITVVRVSACHFSRSRQYIVPLRRRCWTDLVAAGQHHGNDDTSDADDYGCDGSE